MAIATQSMENNMPPLITNHVALQVNHSSTHCVQHASREACALSIARMRACTTTYKPNQTTT
jgi:hypothetical protein